MIVMTNLFSSFDPASSTLKMNWMATLIPILFMATIATMMSKVELLGKSITKMISTETNQISNKKAGKYQTVISIALFSMILMMNLSSLTPFTFTPTAHIAISLSLSSFAWTSLMLFGWISNFKSMMSHLVPQGTPSILIPLMIMIEVTSNLIRPLTLSIRLSANILAGHLLMTLLGSFAMSSSTMVWVSSPVTAMLTFLEMAVSVIQAYVFTILMTLYLSEMH